MVAILFGPQCHNSPRLSSETWNGYIVILTKFPSLAEPEVKITFRTVSNKCLIKMTTFSFQCIYIYIYMRLWTGSIFVWYWRHALIVINAYNNRLIAQIPQCTSPISYDTPGFVTEMCTFTKWCFVGYLSDASWDLSEYWYIFNHTRFLEFLRSFPNIIHFQLRHAYTRIETIHHINRECGPIWFHRYFHFRKNNQ